MSLLGRLLVNTRSAAARSKKPQAEEREVPNKDTLFRQTKVESKADITTRVAREITDAKSTEREGAMKRLRTARLEREASEKAQAAAIPKKKPRAKRGSSTSSGD